MRSQVMCQLGSNIACLTCDRAEHIAHVRVRLLQDVITSLLSAMCHQTAECMAPTVMLSICGPTKPCYLILILEDLFEEILENKVSYGSSAPLLLFFCIAWHSIFF